MNIKLAITLSIIFVLGFGYSNYLPKSTQSFGNSPFPTIVETITIFLLFVAIIYFWRIERRNSSSFELAFKMLGSLLLPAGLISLFLMWFYRMRFVATPNGAGNIVILGQQLPIDGATIWFTFIVLTLSIIYLGLRNYLLATNRNIKISFWKPFIIGTALSLVLGITVGYVLAHGRSGETGLIGGVVLMGYLVGGLIVSLIVALIFHLSTQK